jgi:hypothetical protein
LVKGLIIKKLIKEEEVNGKLVAGTPEFPGKFPVFFSIVIMLL